VKFSLKIIKNQNFLFYMVTVKLRREDGEYVIDIDGRVVRIGDLRPIDFLLIALAYGLGVRYLDKYGLSEYVISCEIENNNLRCTSPCSGNEDRCLVYRLLVKGGISLKCLSRS
jgi:hypothetical protein